MIEKEFHLVGGIKPEEGIDASESVSYNRLAFKSTFSGDDRKKLLKEAVKRENFLYLRALPDQRGNSEIAEKRKVSVQASSECVRRMAALCAYSKKEVA